MFIRKSVHTAAMAKLAKANLDLEQERDTERGIVATLQHRVHMLNVANDAEKAEGMDAGATKVLTALAEILHVEDWSIQEGSETWEGDVWATMFRILVDAGVVEEDHHTVATFGDIAGLHTRAANLTDEIGELRARLAKIAAQETPTANATVKRMARIARGEDASATQPA